MTPSMGDVTVGLRFERSEARKLRSFEHLPGVNGALIRKCIGDAEKGEPTVVVASDMGEVNRIVGGFIALGVKPPAVEQLSGIIMPEGIPHSNGGGGGPRE